MKLPQPTNKEYLCFQLAGENYIHSVNSIIEVIPYSVPVPIPGALEFVEGLINVRGEAVTVISGHRLLTLEKPKDNAGSTIILITTVDDQYGIIVDAVKKIIMFEEGSIAPITNTDTVKNSLIKGTIQFNKELQILLDLTKLSEHIP